MGMTLHSSNFHLFHQHTIDARKIIHSNVGLGIFGLLDG